MLLDAEPDLRVVAQAGDGAEAVTAGLVEDIDLAILDVAMPRMTGLHAAGELKRRHPEIRILILSMHENEQYLYEALKAGASGYVVKTIADRDLVGACRAAVFGEPFLYPGATTALIREYLIRREDDRRAGADALNGAGAAGCKPDRLGTYQPGDRRVLVISDKTVERHRVNILERLGLRTAWISPDMRSAGASSSPERDRAPARTRSVSATRRGSDRNSAERAAGRHQSRCTQNPIGDSPCRCHRFSISRRKCGHGCAGDRRPMIGLAAARRDEDGIPLGT